MENSQLPSFRATSHSTSNIELKVYIDFCLQTDDIIYAVYSSFSVFDVVWQISNNKCPQLPNLTVIDSENVGSCIFGVFLAQQWRHDKWPIDALF